MSLVTNDYLRAGGPQVLQGKDIPDYVTILRIHGPFLFGSTAKLLETTADLNRLASIVILRLRNMTPWILPACTRWNPSPTGGH